MLKNRLIMGLVILMVTVVGVSGCTDDNVTNNTNNQTNQQNMTQNNNAQQNNARVKISSEEAKSIAQKAIQQPGATAGEPMLKNDNGKPTYIVPVMLNGNPVGEIIIDAQTGENVAGVGGAP